MRHLAKATVALVFLTACATASAQSAPTAATASPQAVPAPAAPPSVLMVRVYANDVARSQRFYTDVFGMRASPQRPDEIAMAFPSSSVGIIINRNRPDAPMKSGFIARVADVEVTASRVEAAGGRVIQPARAIAAAHLKVAVVADPDGTEIELIELPSTSH